MTHVYVLEETIKGTRIVTGIYAHKHNIKPPSNSFIVKHMPIKDMFNNKEDFNENV